MKRQQSDPERWVDRVPGRALEDQIGSTLRKVGEPPLPSDAAFASIERRVLEVPRRPIRLGVLAAAACAVVLFCAGVVSAERGVFSFSRRPSAISEIDVPSGSTSRFRGKGKRRWALVGPAKVTVDNASPTAAIELRDGLLVAESGDEALAITTSNSSVTLPPGTSAAVRASAEGGTEVVALDGKPQVSAGSAVSSASSDQIVALRRALDDAGAARPPTIPTRPLVSENAMKPSAGAPEARAASEEKFRPAVRRSVAIAATKAVTARPDEPRVEPLDAVPSPERQVEAPIPPADRPSKKSDLHVPPAFVGTPSPIAAPPAESALVATAIRKLRTDHDPQAALVLLTEHDGRFPSGALKREVMMTRVEALTQLDRRAEALRLLDTAAIAGLPRSRDVQLLRGELRAEANRCTDAAADFEAVLSSGARDESAERALYGRAACRARASDTRNARTDLMLYRSLYPDGRFAAEVRRLLEKP